MKKTYMNPEMEVVKIAARQVLLDASPTIKIGESGTDATVTGDFYDDL